MDQVWAIATVCLLTQDWIKEMYIQAFLFVSWPAEIAGMSMKRYSGYKRAKRATVKLYMA